MSRDEAGQQFWTREAEELAIAPPKEQEPPPAQEAIQAASLPPHPAPSQAPAAVPSLPPLADAFVALLEAEQSEQKPGVRPLWPSTALSGPAVPDDLVEQVSRRVLEQLTDRVVREAVSERVSAIAERLIRDEIERIKSSIE
jgi:hypothetical protein